MLATNEGALLQVPPWGEGVAQHRVVVGIDQGLVRRDQGLDRGVLGEGRRRDLDVAAGLGNQVVATHAVRHQPEDHLAQVGVVAVRLGDQDRRVARPGQDGRQVLVGPERRGGPGVAVAADDGIDPRHQSGEGRVDVGVDLTVNSSVTPGWAAS